MRPVHVLSLLVVLTYPAMARAEVRIKDGTPPDVRNYLENAIKTGQPAHEKRVAHAKADVEKAKSELETVRRAFRKFKAKRIDVQAAEQKVADAEKHLAAVRAEPPLALTPLGALDREGAIGTLPHGLGVSRIVDDQRAVVYVFIERAGADDGRLFTDTDEIGKEVVPSKSPLLLAGVETGAWSQGDRVPADQGVYRLGKIESVDDEKLRVMTRLDVMQYLETGK